VNDVCVLVAPGLADLVPFGDLLEAGSSLPEGAVVVVPADSIPSDRPPESVRLISIGNGPDSHHCFLHLPDGASKNDVELAVAAAVEAAKRDTELEQIKETLNDQTALQRTLLEIGTALSEERDLSRLLEQILTSARELVSADAGSLYLLENDDGRAQLRFVLAHNASCPTRWRETVLPVDPSSIAGMVALRGDPLSIEDAYAIPEHAPYRFNRSFDQDSGYRTKSLLAVPMKKRSGELVGVIQLINRKRRAEIMLTGAEIVDREVTAFGAAELSLLQALASQAAVVLENSRLVEEIQELFESFVRASITAIEQRDPPTSGHSFRVASYTVGLAEAILRNPPQSHTGLRWTRGDLLQIRYAALLHDVGKLGVREAVLTKQSKLYPNQERVVRERFAHARRAHEAEAALALLGELTRQGRAPLDQDIEWLKTQVKATNDELEQMLDALLKANLPTFDTDAMNTPTADLIRKRFPGPYGEPLALVQPDELRALQVQHGNLDDAERNEVESHVVHSLNFLTTLPWPRELRKVPEIAALHHEKLNGRGYPNRLTVGEIPLETRILTIADIYDALTSGDRPYKTSLSPERALAILEKEADEGALDGELVRIFIDSGVYRHPERLA
jgi:HD-GYP domain-containing protein (c-di-GMP phosphodiesterase class II)